MSGALRGRRQLDRGNAHPAAVAADFRWLGVDLRAELVRQDPRNGLRQHRLDQLNVWRNAIAHQSFTLSPGNAAKVAGTDRTLGCGRIWRGNCSALTHQMDRIVRARLTALFGSRPW